MKNSQKKKNGVSAGMVTGMLLIAAGIVAVLHNTGLISTAVYGILFSWQMLLIVLALYSAMARHYWSALVLAAVGAFFLIPEFTEAGSEWLSLYWPLLLVFAGIWIIVKVFVPRRNHRRHTAAAGHRTEDGYVYIDSTLGGYEHIVLEEIFKGATISATLSGTVLDLRHTTIGDGDTIIDIQASLSGIEIFAPADWEIVSEVKFIVGGVEDKRRGRPVDSFPGRRIVLRGSMTLGGIEIKS